MENTTPNTNNFLNWVEIKNFKSIKDLRLDCKRVNVFIGKPNVGKSNILEGLGMLGAGYSDGRFMDGMVRYKELKHLFYDSDILNNDIRIISDRRVSILHSSTLTPKSETGFRFLTANNSHYTDWIDTKRGYHSLENYKSTLTVEVSNIGEFRSVNIGNNEVFGDDLSSIKKYDYANLTEFDNLFQEFLLPPNGPNLYSVIRRNRDLWQEFAKLFLDQHLELVLFDEKQEFILQKKDGPYVWQYPFFSIADTFRRFMFYITAIESNKNSVIIFEEPEVHSFPPYTQDVAYRMIYSEENQFFVSTHSPYLLQTLVSNLADDQLNVFVAYYENYETKVKALTPEELSFVQEYSTDVFFNLDRFIPNAQAANPA